jgi:hypothetical protein
MLRVNTTLKTLNYSGNDMSVDSGAQAFVNGIKDNGAISSVNLLKNNIPVEQAQELVKIMQSKEKLATLCGLSGNEATLDFSNQRLGPGDAVLIANDISDMRALTSLDISNNDLIRGAYEGGYDGNYATDMAGMCPLTRVNSSLTQRYCRSYRPCWCRPRHEGHDEPQSRIKSSGC